MTRKKYEPSLLEIQCQFGGGARQLVLPRGACKKYVVLCYNVTGARKQNVNHNLDLYTSYLIENI